MQFRNVFVFISLASEIPRLFGAFCSFWISQTLSEETMIGFLSHRAFLTQLLELSLLCNHCIAARKLEFRVSRKISRSLVNGNVTSLESCMYAYFTKMSYRQKIEMYLSSYTYYLIFFQLSSSWPKLVTQPNKPKHVEAVSVGNLLLLRSFSSRTYVLCLRCWWHAREQKLI